MSGYNAVVEVRVDLDVATESEAIDKAYEIVDKALGDLDWSEPQMLAGYVVNTLEAKPGYAGGAAGAPGGAQVDTFVRTRMTLDEVRALNALLPNHGDRVVLYTSVWSNWAGLRTFVVTEVVEPRSGNPPQIFGRNTAGDLTFLTWDEVRIYRTREV